MPDPSHTHEAARQQLIAGLRDFARRSPKDAAIAAEYADFAGRAAAVFERSHREGHFTGSAFVVSADGERALLLFHAKLQRWLQPGGHADGQVDLGQVALREAEEETGLRGLLLQPEIFDLDRHGIPERGEEPAHLHWDVRYVLRCSSSEQPTINDESRAFAWHRIADLATDGSLDPSIRRMAARCLALRGK